MKTINIAVLTLSLFIFLACQHSPPSTSAIAADSIEQDISAQDAEDCMSPQSRSIAALSCAKAHSGDKANRLNLLKKVFNETLNVKKWLSKKEAEQVLSESQFEELVSLLALDAETAKVLNHPEVLQHIYLRFYEKEASSDDIGYSLQRIARLDAIKKTDTYDLFVTKIGSKLQDEQIRSQVRQLLESNKSIQLDPKDVARYKKIAKLKQVLAIPTTIRNMFKIMKTGMNREIMDQGLFDFYGSVVLGLKESNLRPWNNEQNFSDINPSQVKNWTPDQLVKMLLFSSEVEAGIDSYSKQSGQTFRAFMPQMSWFMGKSHEEATLTDLARGKTTDQAILLPEFKDMSREGVEGYVRKSRLKCSNTWCREENRHEGSFRTIIRQIKGDEPPPPNPSVGYHTLDFLKIEDSLKHLASRNATEWNANSAYTLWMAHSEGAAYQKIDNIRRDETKHIAIFSGAYRYVFGNQAWTRLGQMLNKVFVEYKYEKENRTSDGGNPLSGENLSMVEAAISHIVVELNVQKYFKSVPLRSLRKIFEVDAPSELNENAHLSIDDQVKIQEIALREKANRQNLLRWTEAERKLENQQSAFEKQNEAQLFQVLSGELAFFRGAEVPNSPAEAQAIEKIAKVSRSFSNPNLAQRTFSDLLRDYQIMNNATVRAKKIAVTFKSIQEGFVINPATVNSSIIGTRVLNYGSVSASSSLVRLEKPAGFNFVPGQAVRITIDTPLGKLTRTLSLASGPEKGFMELAVRQSDSDFKKAFSSLKANEKVEIVGPFGNLNYQAEKPAVMIAGGIGITPFRSIAQSYASRNSKVPHWLVYANRSATDAPFVKEFEDISKAKADFKFSTLYSEQGQRVDADFWKANINQYPKDTQFYIVGPPSMVKETKEVLIQQGVPESQIWIENFIGYAK